MGQTKNAKPLLNTLPGAVCAQWRDRDGKRYGPYYFRFWREGGRLHKEYIKRNEVEAVQAACGRHREEQTARRYNHAEFMQMLRQYKATCRELERCLTTARLFR